MRFGPEMLGQLDAAIGHEWVETNGIGGFASSTIVGLNTRRYHGLLVAATRPPVGRLVLLSTLEETIQLDGTSFDLATNRYPGAIHPQGYTHLREFRLDPFPTFVYQLDGITLEKTLFPIHGSNAFVIQYTLAGAGSAGSASSAPRRAAMTVRPLVAFRDYHGLSREDASLRWHTWFEAGAAAVRPDWADIDLRLSHDARRVTPDGDWYRHVEYSQEEQRGLDFVEDLYCPFELHFDLSSGSTSTIVASTEAVDVARVDELRRREVARRRSLAARLTSTEPLVQRLASAADHYIVDRGEGKTVIAGYHWFGDWGRDTMIALPGLALATRRFDVAKSVLSQFAQYVDRGMLPNRFPDAGEAPEYNNVDSTLWYFEAIRAYVAATSDTDSVAERWYPVLQDIVRWHVEGTRYGIGVDTDGLLASGADGVQLTWMDSKIGDWVVTPRRGKAVEIQALWYNALRTMAAFALVIDDAGEAARYTDLADRAQTSFNARFWNQTRGCLYDVVDGPDGDDESLRPNQILAIGLHHPILETERGAAVVAVVERELLTPMGLRSLAATDQRYRARYDGGVQSRDSAYHQGTVWPWLLGPFISAYVRVHGGTETSRARAAEWLRAFDTHLDEAGVGHVSEIFDAEPPHAPRGCVAQAWSVAELLRCATEDVFISTKRRKPQWRSVGASES